MVDPTEKSIVALWMTVCSQDSNRKTWRKTGLNFDFYISPIIDSLRQGEDFQSRCCGWEFDQMQLASVLNLGLKEKRAIQIASIAKDIGAAARPIIVSGRLRSQAEDNGEDLEVGDVVLEINGACVGRMADVRILSQLEMANVTVLRNKEEKTITTHPKLQSAEVVCRILCWAGAILHQTLNSALEQTTTEFVRVSKQEGITDLKAAIYISSIIVGSPAKDNLRSVHWIVEVDERKVRSLDDLVEVISSSKDRNEEDYVRIKMMGRKGNIKVVSMRLDSKFWPAWTLERKGQKWIRSELE